MAHELLPALAEEAQGQLTTEKSHEVRGGLRLEIFATVRSSSIGTPCETDSVADCEAPRTDTEGRTDDRWRDSVPAETRACGCTHRVVRRRVDQSASPSTHRESDEVDIRALRHRAAHRECH